MSGRCIGSRLRSRVSSGWLPKNSETLRTLANLADMHIRQNRWDVAQVMVWQGRFDEAEGLLSKVLLSFTDRPVEDPLVQYTLTLLHEVGLGLGRPETRSRWLMKFERASRRE